MIPEEQLGQLCCCRCFVSALKAKPMRTSTRMSCWQSRRCVPQAIRQSINQSIYAFTFLVLRTHHGSQQDICLHLHMGLSRTVCFIDFTEHCSCHLSRQSTSSVATARRETHIQRGKLLSSSSMPSDSGCDAPSCRQTNLWCTEPCRHPILMDCFCAIQQLFPKWFLLQF